jgi:hypothetical protein
MDSVERLRNLAKNAENSIAWGLDEIADEIERLRKNCIRLSAAEIQSKQTRVLWAEGLILQLPATHEGRNSWLLNYGIGTEAKELRASDKDKYIADNLVPRVLEWDNETECLKSAK